MKKMLFSAMILMATLVGCQKLEKGTFVQDKEGVEAIKADSTNAGKRFAVEGYLYAGSSSIKRVEQGKATTMYVYTEPLGQGNSVCFVQMNYQTFRNGFSIAGSGGHYKDEDLSFTDNEGKKHNCQTKALFSFTAVRKPEQKYNSETRKWAPTGDYFWDFEDVRVDVE